MSNLSQLSSPRTPTDPSPTLLTKIIQVSDAILDACLKDDPWSKVACETATKTGLVS